MTRRNGAPITVKEDPSVGAEVLAQSIVDVALAAKKLLNSRLTEETISVLIKHQSGVSMANIKKVLHGAADLERIFIKR